MNLELKLQKLEEKHKTILSEISDLKRQRKAELTSALSHIELGEFDSHTLIGALLWVVESDHSSDKKEEWRRQGAKFCTKTRPKSERSRPTSAQKKTSQSKVA